MLQSQEFEELKLHQSNETIGCRLKKCQKYVLVNNKSGTDETLIEKLINTNMPDVFEIAFLPSHLNVFSENMGDISEEHSKIFHQHISTMKTKNHWKWDCNLGDYLGVSTW